MTILGTLDLRDWDTGAMITLGGEIVSYVVDGETRQLYAADVNGLDSGVPLLDNKVPLFFATPEDVYQEYVLPNFTFRRSDMTPAFDRQPWYQWVARAPAPGANKITLEDGTEGYDSYVNQFRATPFDITYECIIAARREQESQLMLMYALKHFLPPSFIFKVFDSLGDLRHYDALGVIASNTSELIDMADRTIGWTIAFTVRAEIDLHADREYPAMTEFIATYSQYNPDDN